MRGSRLALGLAFVLALVLDAWFYTGYFAGDDNAYLHGARALLDLEVRPDLLTSRLGVTAPGGLIYWLSGGSVAAVAWFHVVYHLVLVGLAFVLGRALCDARVGVLAAVLAASNPLFYVYAGAVLPDNATACWLGVVLVLLERMRRQAGSGPIATRRALVGYGATGVALGVAYACRETALIMIVPVAVCILAAAPRLRDGVWLRDGLFVLLGLVGFAVIKALALRLVSGEWVWRPSVVQGSDEVLSALMSEQGDGPLERVGFAITRCLSPFVPVSFWLLVLGVIGHGVTRWRGARARTVGLMAFFWWPLIYITVGSTSLTSYQPPSLQTRYYSIAWLPAIVMTAGFLVTALDRWRAWERPRRWPGGARWTRAAAVALALGLAGMIVIEAGLNARRAGNIFRGTMVRSFIAAYERARARYPQFPIVLSPDYRQLLTPLFFPEAPSDVHAHSSLTPGDPPEPPFVYLGAVSRSHAGAIRSEHGDVAVQTLAEIHAPATRAAALRRALREVVTLSPDDPPRSSPRRSTVMLLVTAPGDDPLGGPVAITEPEPAGTPGTPATTMTTDAAIPLHRVGRRVGFFDRRVRIIDLVDGHFVSWSEREPIALQFFDRSDETTATTSPAAQLPGDGRALRLAFDLRLTRGDRVTVELAAAGHGVGDASRVVARARETVTLVGRARYTRVLLDLVSSQPMGSWRGRIIVTPETPPGRPGGLHIARPRLLTP